MLAFQDQIKRLDRSEKNVPLLQAVLAASPAGQANDPIAWERFELHCQLAAMVTGLRCSFNPDGRDLMKEAIEGTT